MGVYESYNDSKQQPPLAPHNTVQEALDGLKTQTLVYATQATWFVDPVNGLDTNTGLTSGTAIKTLAQLQARLGINMSYQPYLNAPQITINIMGNIPTTDTFQPNFLLRSPSMLLEIKSTGTTIRRTTSTFTGVLAVNRTGAGGGNAWQLTDSTIPGAGGWGQFVGSRIRVTTGAHAGTICFVMADLGGGVARVTSPCLTTGQAANFVTTGTISIGDSYVIEDLFQVHLESYVIAATGDLNGSAPGGTTGDDGIVEFRDLQITNSGIMHLETSISNATIFTQCQITGVHTPAVGQFWYINCGFFTGAGNVAGTVFASGGAVLIVYAGGQVGGFTNTLGGTVTQYDQDFLFQGVQFTVQNGAMVSIGSMGIFGSPSDAIAAGINTTGIAFTTGQIVLGSLQSGPQGLYGNGNVGVGLRVLGGSGVRYNGATTILNVTGTGGDFVVGTSGSLASVNPDTNGLLSALAQTWTNFQTARTSGFGGFVLNPKNQAQLIPN